ncbi:cobalamin biosynthesis protein CobG [Marinovum sp.]|uniref:cobalamin biosynthesis protein CobG n=1 Tax=Marinovum sp. TaxID=2024839 RepID=UPI002B27506E|nr:cobalamin biosynthesis protein CobG [Marinovum sp.]
MSAPVVRGSSAKGTIAKGSIVKGPIVKGPIVKGWCPGAHRPMLSGDGLLVRVRPFRSELNAAQVLALCDLAERFGNGMIDLTSRANLQIRGVSEPDHPALLAELATLGLIDDDPAVEGHRNILMPALRDAAGLSARLHDALLATLPQLPDLPEKMGFALDTGRAAILTEASADIRFELDAVGQLILRADGSARGRAIPEAEAMAALIALARWFTETGGPANGRMARHLRQTPLPPEWTTTAPRDPAPAPAPGPLPEGTLLGAAFGKLAAPALRALIATSGTPGLRLLPGRLVLLLEARPGDTPFVTAPDDPLMRAHACPGAPFCPQATVATLDLARELAPRTRATLHVSGCAKGCAHPRPAALTLTGREGRFDLVRDGAPWDSPTARALTPDQVKESL